MNDSSCSTIRIFRYCCGFALRNLALASVITVCGALGSSAVYAQATAGKIFGKAPAGETVSVKSMSIGLQRNAKVNAKGRYSIGPLPAGVYTVTLEKDGNPVVKHLNVPVTVGRGTEADFYCDKGQCR